MFRLDVTFRVDWTRAGCEHDDDDDDDDDVDDEVMLNVLRCQLTY